MKEPTYKQQLKLLEAFMNSSISEKMKVDLMQAFCEKFSVTKEQLLKDLCGESNG